MLGTQVFTCVPMERGAGFLAELVVVRVVCGEVLGHRATKSGQATALAGDLPWRSSWGMLA